MTPFLAAAAEKDIPLLVHAQEATGIGRMDDERVHAVSFLFVDAASLGPENVDYLLRFLPGGKIVVGSDFPATRALPPLDGLEEPRCDVIPTGHPRHNAQRFLLAGYHAFDARRRRAA